MEKQHEWTKDSTFLRQITDEEKIKKKRRKELQLQDTKPAMVVRHNLASHLWKSQESSQRTLQDILSRPT